MLRHICKVIWVCIGLVYAMHAQAQEKWPSPEVEQMYNHAKDYVASGNYKDAIITYRQALLLAPGKMILYKGLGGALYQYGDYTGAKEILVPLLDKRDADAECFSILAESQWALDERKHARNTLEQGLARFPMSGLLYHEQGIMYIKEKKRDDALEAWTEGIKKEPAYTPNYYDASMVGLNAGKVVWGLLYGEMFLAMAHDTVNDDTLKGALFAGYKQMFDDIGKDVKPQDVNAKRQPAASSFIAAVLRIYTTLTPVVSDGISVENLTMVRARFIMEWVQLYNNKYPFPLFLYQQQSIKEGYFDMYNEWLFGKAENEVTYDAWNKFHEGDMNKLHTWISHNQLHPDAIRQYISNDFKQ